MAQSLPVKLWVMFQQNLMLASSKLFAFWTVFFINSSIPCVPDEIETLFSLFLIHEASILHCYFKNFLVDWKLFLKTMQTHLQWIIKICCNEQEQHKTFDCIMSWVYLFKAGEVILKCLNKVQCRVSWCQLL